MRADGRLTIVILATTYQRSIDILDIIIDSECEHSTIKLIKDRGILYTNDAVYTATYPDNACGVLADQVIIEDNAINVGIVARVLSRSCVPEEYQIIDDRELLMSKYQRVLEDY